MKVRTKLIIGFAVVVALLWFIAIYAGNNYAHLKNQFATTEENVIQGTLAIAEIENSAADIYRETREYVLYNNAVEKEAVLSHIGYLEQLGDDYLLQGSNISQEQYQANQIIVTRIDKLNAYILSLIDLKESGTSSAALLTEELSSSPPELLDLQESIEQQKELYIKELAAAKTAVDKSYTGGIHSIYFGAAFLTLLAIGAAISTTRGILKPLRDLRKGTEMIAQGNLNYRVDTKGKDEIGQLSRAFDQMAQKLNRSMTSIDKLNLEMSERKHAEVALKESEQKYRNLFEHARDAILIADTQAGIILDVNTAACKLLDLPREKIIGMHQTAIHPPEMAEKYKKVFRDHIEKGIVITDNIIVQRADGSHVPVDISASVIKLADKTVIQGVFRDITERKHMEKALQESEETFSKAFHASPDAISISTLTDGTFLEVNESYTRITGYSRGELIFQNADKYNMWANAEQREKMLKKIQQRIKMYNEEFDFRTKPGEIRTMLVSTEYIQIGGQPCLLVVSSDITERKQMEKALRDSEEKFSKAFRASPQQIIITRVRDNITLDVNDSYTRVTGFTREETVGHTANELGVWIKPEDTERMLSILREQGRVYNEEFNFRNKSGNINTELLSVEHINLGGEDCLISILTDITERKKMEESLADEATRRRILIEQSRDGIVILDQNGKVYEANRRFAEMLGYSHEEVLQLNVWDWEFQFPREKVLDMIRSIDEKGDHFETQHRRKDGTTYDVEISTNGALFSGQKLIFCVCRDITERKRVEKALRESEEKFSKAFRAIPEAVSIASLDDEVFLEVNDSFVSFSGYSREEIIGHTAKELNIWANPNDRYRMEQLMEKYGHFENEEFTFLTKSGETLTILLSGDKIDVGGEPCSLTIGTNITERKKMENTLRESEEKFSKAFHAMPEAVTISRLDDGKFIDVNETFCRDNGYTREEVIGHGGEELNLSIGPHYREKVIKLIKKHGCVKNMEFEIQDKSGEMQAVLFSADIVNISGEPCLLSIRSDITERKKMENALRESEEKFSKAFHAMPESVSIARMKDGTFIDVNDNFCIQNGYDRQEIIGHTSKELNNWVDISKRDQIVKLVKKQGRVTNIECEMKKKSGEIHTILMSADIINIRGEPCLLSIGSDITDRKRMEQALQESEEKFSKAFHAIPETLSISTSKENRFLDVNESFLKLNGLTREQVIGHTASEIELLKPGDARNKIREVLQKQDHFTNEEIEFKAKSGKMLTFLFSANTVNIGREPCLLIIGNDITERKRIETALRESEENFSKAFRAIPEAVSIATLKDGVFLDINDSFVTLNGYSREEVIGHKSKELKIWVNPGDRYRIKQLMEKDGRFENEEFAFQTKAGEMRTVLLSADIINFGGKPCMLTIGSDITERKQAEIKLKQALAELESSNARLQATNKELESFSYSVSHDLRSPLRGIDGFSQALLEDYSAKLDDKGQDYLNRLRTASQKMGELIDGILKLSRLTRSEMHRENVDLSSLAKEIIARLQETHPQRRAKFIIDSGLMADGDPQMLRALLENLLGNAWKFTRKTPRARIEFGSTVNGEKKTFFIKDNGAGFDMAFKDKLFGAFQRLHDTAEFPGTGIGLATVQRIINRHGGSIRAEGEVDKGATFYFTLS